MARALHFDLVSGISGNMILGSLLDLGVDQAALTAPLRSLPLEDWKLVTEEVRRGPIRARWCDVVQRGEPRDHRHYGEVKRIIEAADLPAPVAGRALEAFRILARAEGAVHGVDPEKVAFHEVGAVDSIVDIVGVCHGMHLLEIERVTCSPVPLGHGSVESRHGPIPVPAPATVEILRQVPIRQVDCPYELTTPTGAALMVALAERFGTAPDMVLTAVGYGAGADRPTPLPNVLRVFLGESDGPAAEFLTVCETTIDNTGGEALGYLLERLLEAGALDAFFTPIVMKKSRPAQTLTVLCRTTDQPALEALIFQQVPTLGIRSFAVARHALSRHFVTLQTPWGEVRIKEAWREGSVLHAWPEYEDLRRAATGHDRGITALREDVMDLYRRRAKGL